MMRCFLFEGIGKAYFQILSRSSIGSSGKHVNEVKRPVADDSVGSESLFESWVALAILSSCLKWKEDRGSLKVSSKDDKEYDRMFPQRNQRYAICSKHDLKWPGKWFVRWFEQWK
jgi:hypothetical protein